VVVVVLLVLTGGATYTVGAVVEYSVVVVVGGTSSAQAPTNPIDIATAAAKATFFRSFMLGLPALSIFSATGSPKFKGRNSRQSSSTRHGQASCRKHAVLAENALSTKFGTGGGSQERLGVMNGRAPRTVVLSQNLVSANRRMKKVAGAADR